MKYLKFLRLIGFSLIVLVLTVAGVIAQDSNDVALEFPILEDGAVVEGMLDEDVTTQVYIFNASAGDSVTISMIQGESSNLDPFIVLMGSAGEIIAMDDDGGELLYSSLLTTEIVADGTYYLLVTSFVNVDGILMEAFEITEQIYTVTVAGITAPDMESTALDYTPIEDASPLVGNSSLQEPVHYYLFDGHAGDVVTIELDTLNFPGLLYLISPSGGRIAVGAFSFVGNDFSNATIGNVELAEDGQYLIMAMDVLFYEALDTTPEVGDELVFTGGEFTITLIIDN